MEQKIIAWITRDKDGSLCLSARPPQKSKEIWITSDFVIDKNNFPEVKWEDEEPTKIELTIKICK